MCEEHHVTSMFCLETQISSLFSIGTCCVILWAKAIVYCSCSDFLDCHLLHNANSQWQFLAIISSGSNLCATSWVYFPVDTPRQVLRTVMLEELMPFIKITCIFFLFFPYLCTSRHLLNLATLNNCGGCLEELQDSL